MDSQKWQRYLETYIEKQPEDKRLALEIEGVVTIDTTIGEFKDILEKALSQAQSGLKVGPPKWEYRWISNDFDELDEIGADGWEAVLISETLILFKRAIK